jgi:hypothetical protein
MILVYEIEKPGTYFQYKNNEPLIGRGKKKDGQGDTSGWSWLSIYSQPGPSILQNRVYETTQVLYNYFVTEEDIRSRIFH